MLINQMERIIMSLLIAGCLIGLTACGSDQSRLRHVEKQQANAVHGDPAPDPRILARYTITVIIDKDGQIFVQNAPLGPEEDLEAAIRKSITKKRQNWPLTILVDPAQKGQLLLKVIEVAERVKPGKVNVVTQEISMQTAEAEKK